MIAWTRITMAVCLARSSKQSPSSIAVHKYRLGLKDPAVIADPAALRWLVVVPACEAAVLHGLVTTEAASMDLTDFKAAHLGHAQAKDRTSIATSLVRRGHIQRSAIVAHATEPRTRDNGIATPNPETPGRTSVTQHPRVAQTIVIAPMQTRRRQTRGKIRNPPRQAMTRSLRPRPRKLPK